MKTVYDNMGRKIQIEDNPFGKTYHEQVYDYVSKSLYRFGSQDGPAPLDRRSYVYIHSEYSKIDVDNLGIMDKLFTAESFQPYKELPLIRTTINLSVPSDTNFAHTHPNQISVLYYVNLDWRPEWAGETLFYDDNTEEIIYASVYKPSRLIVFDGEIPHSIRVQSNSAPHYRFSLAMFFDKGIK
jgi:hypothetical protein